MSLRILAFLVLALPPLAAGPLCASQLLDTGVYGHSTTLLPSGDIMVAGGVTATGGVTVSSVQIYSMVSNSWSQASYIGSSVSPGLRRSSHTATLMGNGKILIAGGFNESRAAQNSAYVYDPVANSWAGPYTMSARGGHTATLINKGRHSGNVLICGGQVGAAASETCEIFVATATPNTFVVAAPMSSSRVGHTASAISEGRVFVSGGRNHLGTYLPTNEIYDPETDSWRSVDALLEGRAYHNATVLNNGLIMIDGGRNALDAKTCKAGSPMKEDECWYIDMALRGNDVGADNRQDVGSNFYISGAEFFDQNGGRVTLNGQTRGVAPYRYAYQASVLDTEGKLRMRGGYGNIAPTYFKDDPAFLPGSISNNIKVLSSTNTARVNPAASLFRFPLEFTFSREVDGRLVNADAFISKPLNGEPSLTVQNASFYLDYSTAPLDGSPVGNVIGRDFKHGEFSNTVQLKNPSGLLVFAPQSLMATDTSVTGQLHFIPASLDAGMRGTLTKNAPMTNLTLDVTIKLPKAYMDGVINGTLMLSGGTIEYAGPVYSYTINVQGSAEIPFNGTLSTLDPLDEENATLTIPGVNFTGVQGSIANSSTTITSNMPLPAGVMTAGFNVLAKYTSTRVDISSASFSFDTSSAIVREMIFANDLLYKPKPNEWEINDTTYTWPVYSHSVVITPGSDVAYIGGRNCEVPPYTDCLRTTMTFTASPVMGVTFDTTREEWVVPDKMSTRRAFHTGTLLPNGKILACGGSDGVNVLSSCELWDPATRIWSPTGSMNSPRSKHTATLLPNGNVLAAGGAISASTQTTNTAEVYYPASGRWSNTGPMNPVTGSRANHTATLLPNGNVLVAGGNTPSAYGVGYSSSSEIYFTTMAVWASPVGASKFMSAGRAQHTATLLKNGNVLVTGGVNGLGANDTYELFVSSAQKWDSNPASWQMTSRRYAHRANLLRDGRVLVTGGSDNAFSHNTAEIYNGSGFSSIGTFNTNRTNHTATLLPNGKVLLVGGEQAGSINGSAEYIDMDFLAAIENGTVESRANHATVVTSSGLVVSIGGWNGSGYLDTVSVRYFQASPDVSGFEPQDLRNPRITSVTNEYFDRGGFTTLLSGTSNFHGFSEASGGGAGPANSSHHNPRVYLHAVDHASGFMVDLTSAIYRTGTNPNWELTRSSITLQMPGSYGSLPYGYYHIRVADNAQYSHSHLVQVTIPRPVGKPSVPQIAASNWRTTTTITWEWSTGTINTALAEVSGYGVYAASNSVFLDTVAYSANASYIQRDLAPNSEASVLVNGYNMCGAGEFSASATYYTLANPPSALRVNKSEFNSAFLEWSPGGNSGHTAYQVTMCPGVGCFNDPLKVSTAVWFDDNHTSTAAVVERLSPSVEYFFRVQAVNGKFPSFSYGSGGELTAFSAGASTVTVGSINDISWTPSTDSIRWSWQATTGPYISFEYTFYDYSAGTVPVQMAPPAETAPGTSITSVIKNLLAPNVPYGFMVRAVYDSGGGKLYGPPAQSPMVYTLANDPSAGPSAIVTTSDTVSVFWNAHGNSLLTTYDVRLSSSSSFDVYLTSSVKATTTIFEGLDTNTRYYVRAQATNGDGRPGNLVDLGYAYTKVNPPNPVTITKVSMSGVDLQWDASGNNAQTYYSVIGTTRTTVTVEGLVCDFTQGYSTIVAPGAEYTGSSLVVNGLLTSTRYCFGVTAHGLGGYNSATTMSASTVTVAGPGGAPSGSIAGTSDPAGVSLISGTLPNGRLVSMTIPAGSFEAPTPIAISSSSLNICNQSISTITLQIFTSAGAQPQDPVTLTFKYTTLEETYGGANSLGSNKDRLVLARYNDRNGDCLPLETKVDEMNQTVTATLNHFSYFQLIVKPAVNTLSGVRVYPNPFLINRGNGYVTIEPLPANAKVRVYTLSGEKVWEGNAGTTGVLVWKGRNRHGELVASGIYLAVIDSSAGKKIKKIAVER